MTMVTYSPRSQNVKTGPIPTAMIEKSTCPDSCELKGNGCYANSGMMRFRWDQVTAGAGIPWKTFCGMIKNLPDGTLWRYGTAGDLPGYGERIDFDDMLELVHANTGKRGFAFTHKPLTPENIRRIRGANEAGFVVNLSAWNGANADVKLASGAGPVVCLIPWGTPEVSRTPAGTKIVACPAQTRDRVTCKKCGLCAKQRDFVIGFYPHGPGRSGGGKNVNARLQEGIDAAI